jgi:DNA polymerase-2
MKLQDTPTASEGEHRLNETLLDAFVLTRQWQDTAQSLEYEFWASSSRGPVRILIREQEAVCFIQRGVDFRAPRRFQVELCNLDGDSIDALYFPTQRLMLDARNRLRRQGTPVYESDIRPADRYLMERFITGSMSIAGPGVERNGFLEFVNPKLERSSYRADLTVASLDIETQGLAGQLYSIAVATPTSEKVFMVGTRPDTEMVRFCPDERATLQAFLEEVRSLDPDILIGWNVVEFDLHYLAQACARHRLPFSLGRNQEPAKILAPRARGQSMIAQLTGRVVLDGIATLKAAMYSFESFGLGAVAKQILGKAKLIDEEGRVEEIDRLYRDDPEELAAYNIEDCRLVLEIFNHAGLIGFALERATLTGLPIGRQGGSVAAFDYLYLPRLHHHGYVAPDLDAKAEAIPSPGGHVMDSQPGLHENVLVLDFKSLYPSIIRTFHIDPLAMAVPGADPIPGFEGASFSRGTAILPEIVESLWQARDEAKKLSNEPVSQAIKILMNSLYGVLGTPNCRFFSPKLAGSITRRGKEILTKSRKFIEELGYTVIYGDTDSAFVLLGPGHDEESAAAIGRELADLLNTWWRNNLESTLKIESRLEVEFETHYLRFLMPTIRGSETGSKKRYAGLLRDPDGELAVSFTGMESVRTDWTLLAREFQRELYRRIFFDQPYEEYIQQIARELIDGKHDNLLVYRKRLRKPVDEYLRNVPPHVQAARKMRAPGHWINYVITLHGPEPADARKSPMDYAHYLDRQIAPVADGILHFLDTSFAAITDRQMELF